jgi:hypothetical protein
VASHSVHGTWVDMLTSHLEWSEEGFTIEPAYDVSDTRMLSPAGRLNLEAAMGYCERWLPAQDSDAAAERIIDLIDRSEALSVAFEGWLAERQV